METTETPYFVTLIGALAMEMRTRLQTALPPQQEAWLQYVRHELQSAIKD